MAVERWMWKQHGPPQRCGACGDPTTVLYGRNPSVLPREQVRGTAGGVTAGLRIITSYPGFDVDAVGVCLSCVPPGEVRNNPGWYEE